MAAPFLSLLFLAPAADGWLGIYLDSEREEAVVSLVMADSPAQKAGLQIGDVLLAVGGKSTPTRDEFIAAIRAAKAGDRVTIKIQRDGKEQDVAVTLGERPEQVPAPAAATAPVKPAHPQAPAPAHESKHPAAAEQRGYLGLSVGETDDGVVVQRVIDGGPAAKAGIQVGEAITNVADHRITSLADLDAALRALAAGRQVAVGLHGEKGSRSVLVTLGPRPGAVGSEHAPTPSTAVAPTRARTAEPAGPGGPAQDRKIAELEAELASLRAELADLRKQLDALRQSKGRE